MNEFNDFMFATQLWVWVLIIGVVFGGGICLLNRLFPNAMDKVANFISKHIFGVD